MADFTFHKEKSTSALLYICDRLGGSWDMYSLLKILYFSECKHLVRYGRPITGDTIIAMDYGPVPLASYDSVKSGRLNAGVFEIEDTIVLAKEKPNLDCLSESDIECIDEAISENKNLSFGALKVKSHDESYEWAIKNNGKNSTIPYLEIAKAFGADKHMLDYIRLNSENQNCVFNGVG